MFVNCFYVVCNISFKEHLPEDGHTRWPEHVGGYAIYKTKFVYELVSFVSHNE
jgi:hypothetical protein